MFTLVGWTESQDSATLAAVAALADPHIRAEGDNVVVPSLNRLFAALAIGPNITRARLTSATLRRVANLELLPLNRDAEPLSPVPILLFPHSPIILGIGENLNAEAAEDLAGAARSTILAWLADGPPRLPAGDIFHVGVTGTAVLVANAWTNGSLTLREQLPPGRYAVVGARFESPALQAFRLVFVGQPWRPGGVGTDAVADLDVPGQRDGGWGEWGQFEPTIPPTVDYLSNAADTAQTGVLDIIKVA